MTMFYTKTAKLKFLFMPVICEELYWCTEFTLNMTSVCKPWFPVRYVRCFVWDRGAGVIFKGENGFKGSCPPPKNEGNGAGVGRNTAIKSGLNFL